MQMWGRARVLVCCCINWGLISFLSPDYDDDDDDDDEFGDKDGDDLPIPTLFA